MTTIDAVVQRIVTDVSTVTGITLAHTYPPDSINQNLQALIYPANIVWSWGPEYGRKSVTFDVMIEVGTSIAGDSTKSVAALAPFADTIPAALFADEFLNAQVEEWDTITGGIGRREPTGPIVLILTVTGCQIEAAL
jgi:hypothetical protein